MPVPAESSIAQIAAAGRAAHPQLDVPEAAIATLVAGRELDVRCAEDLYVAAGALAGVTSAIRLIDGLLADVAPALRGVVLDHEIAEVVQELSVKLLVGDGTKHPALTGYAGKGPLRAWLRVSLMRAGFDRRRRPTDVVLDESAWLAIASDDDPALVNLQRSAGPAVRAALTAALAKLDARERLLLRQHLLDGLSPPDLATLHGVHRVTAFRWLAAIRARVLGEVREVLGAELGLDPSGLASLMRRMRASVAPTVERMLVVTPDPDT